MVKVRFYLYDITYKSNNGDTVIYLFGRTEQGDKIMALDNSIKPYFLLQESATANREDLVQKLKSLKQDDELQIISTESITKEIAGKPINLLRINTITPKTTPKIARYVRDWDEVKQIYEFDIPFVKKYIIDKGLIPFTLIEVDGELVEKTKKSLVFNAKEITQLEETTITNTKVLAFDIETYNPDGKIINPQKYPIIMLSFYGKNFEKVITWKRFKTDKKYIEFVDGERELLLRFKEIVESYNPDIITGYFSDGFDMPYIHDRAEKYKIPLNLGIDNSKLVVGNKDGKVARIKGIVHIDIYKFIKKIIGPTMDTQRFNLDSVAEELLGRKKEEVDLDTLAEAWDTCSPELERFAYYNLVDSLLVYDLTEKVLPNIIELSKIVKILPFDGTRRGFSQLVESYLMYLTKEYKEIIPRKPSSHAVKGRIGKKYQGAFVVEPIPGMYEDIVVLDFRSLYPSIISSHNISEDALNIDEEGILVPGLKEEYRFSDKKKGFIPNVIDSLVSRRMRVKEIIKTQEKKDAILLARSETLKLLANSLYGYYGFFGSRWYSWECAESITAWARYYIKDLIKKADEKGFKVIYGDTDSVFLLLNGKSIDDVKNFTRQVNQTLPGTMELEYEGYFKRGIFVEAKSGSGGAKKKYALISSDNKIKITGFATVRRNWSNIAKKTQKHVLEILLKENDRAKVVTYLRKVIDDLRNHKVSIEDVKITTQLQKHVEDYVQIGPHVAVAKRLQEKGFPVVVGMGIDYVIIEGKDMIRDRARTPEELGNEKYDATYYIDNQVLPAIESIMAVYKCSLDEIKKGHSQSGLSEFF
ncbi:MAG: ribonuclease H-like domain-containing protein [Nanoarchaeota archaeon]|nr:ribonuclease H-like domain-containing protein [Nanoarchaeota archaeon]